jgi:hypothetical protein
MLDPRGQLLRAALGFAGCSMPSYDRALHALRTWLDSWAGIGHVAVGASTCNSRDNDKAKSGATSRIWGGAAWPSFILTT